MARVFRFFTMLPVLVLMFFSKKGLHPAARSLPKDEDVDVSILETGELLLNSTKVVLEGQSITNFFPVDGSHYEIKNGTEWRRKLGTFFGCSLCTCCTANKTQCLSNFPCCYSIDCFTGEFGRCKFKPVCCTCTRCGF